MVWNHSFSFSYQAISCNSNCRYYNNVPGLMYYFYIVTSDLWTNPHNIKLIIILWWYSPNDDPFCKESPVSSQFLPQYFVVFIDSCIKIELHSDTIQQTYWITLYWTYPEFCRDFSKWQRQQAGWWGWGFWRTEMVYQMAVISPGLFIYF